MSVHYGNDAGTSNLIQQWINDRALHLIKAEKLEQETAPAGYTSQGHQFGEINNASCSWNKKEEAILVYLFGAVAHDCCKHD